MKNIILLAVIITNISLKAQGLKPTHLYNIHTRTNEIVLTIDDGPTKGVTDRILDVLKKYDVTATFFVVGSRIKGKEYLLRRMRDEGHIVANHTFSHPSDLRKLSRREIRNQLLSAHDAIVHYTGNGDYYYFRAPGGVWSPQVARAANSTRIASEMKGPILWDIGGSVRKAANGMLTQAADWACWARKYDISVRRCLKGYINETKTRRGGVVLFHDLKMQSAELIEKYVRHFKKDRNFRFVSLNEVNLDR